MPVARASSAAFGVRLILRCLVQHAPKGAIGRLDLAILGVTRHVGRNELRIEIENIRCQVENPRELLNHLVFGRVTSIVLKIVEVWRQYLAAISTPKTFCDLFLGQSRLLARFRNHLAKGLHFKGRSLTISLRQSERQAEFLDAEFLALKVDNRFTPGAARHLCT